MWWQETKKDAKETSTFVKLDFNKNIPETKLISPPCKVLSKVPRKINNINNLVMLLYSVLASIKQSLNVPICIFLCVFFFREDNNVLTIFPMTTATSSYTSKFILTILANEKCCKGIWQWFYICKEPLEVANPELVEDLSLQGQQNYSAMSNPNQVD